jgi:hypothetical protein
MANLTFASDLFDAELAAPTSPINLLPFGIVSKRLGEGDRFKLLTLIKADRHRTSV